MAKVVARSCQGRAKKAAFSLQSGDVSAYDALTARESEAAAFEKRETKKRQAIEKAAPVERAAPSLSPAVGGVEEGGL